MQTRREFFQSALTSATWLAVGGEALAETLLGQSAPPPRAAAGEASTGWKNIPVGDGSDMRIFSARPKKVSGKVPGVLVLQEAFGVNAHIRDVCQRIADLGYVTAAPELYHRTAPGFEGDYENSAPSMAEMKKMSDGSLAMDLKAAYEWLSQDGEVDAGRIASVGYCMGGRASFLANAILPLKAAVSYYGGGIAPDLLNQATNQHGPILLFWGGEDTHVGVEKPRKVADALRDAKKKFVHIEFSDAQHGFFCDVRKSYNPLAARESWALFDSFFRDHLGKK